MIKATDGSRPTNGSKSSNGSKHADGSRAAKGIKVAPVPRSPALESGADVHDGLTASVQVLPLPAGLYLFSVKAAAPVSSDLIGKLALPAMHVGLGPGVRSDQVEFISGPSTHGSWLFSARDVLIAKIGGAGATIILNSVRAPGGEVLSISVERLDTRADAAAAPGQAPEVRAALADKPAAAKPDSRAPLGVEIGAHIRTRGDMTFTDAAWAGRVGPGLWIESYAVRPLEHFGPGDIEYKALTGTGFETPWLSDGKMCGTKGMATPLVGFAIRLKPGASNADYDCEYSGYFRSGTVVGPLRNGSPCRSTVGGDSLEGIQVNLVKRPAASGKRTGGSGAGVRAAGRTAGTRRSPERRA